MKKLAEVQELVKMDRRQIQELEKMDIAIKPTHKNKMGHLLYGDEEIRRLWLIKFYKELGYRNPEIKKILEEAEEGKTFSLDDQICELRDRIVELENLLTVVEGMNDQGLQPRTTFTDRFVAIIGR